MKVRNDIMSYESSKWYIKLWRNRWYLYAIFLHFKNFIDVQLWIDYLIQDHNISDDTKNLKTRWREIKNHIEISKMYKFSTKIERED